MAHNLPPHMANLNMGAPRPSPPPGFSAPPPGFQHQMAAQGPQMTGTPPPPGFGPSMMEQMKQPGTPSQMPPRVPGAQNGKLGGPQDTPRRGPGGSQNLGMPPQQVPQQLPPQMFTTAAQLLDLTDSMYTLPPLGNGRRLGRSSHIELGGISFCRAKLV